MISRSTFSIPSKVPRKTIPLWVQPLGISWKEGEEGREGRRNEKLD